MCGSNACADQFGKRLAHFSGTSLPLGARFRLLPFLELSERYGLAVKFSLWCGPVLGVPAPSAVCTSAISMWKNQIGERLCF